MSKITQTKFNRNRIKDALCATVAHMRQEIETSHKNGKIPADYSLGFTNGLIFVEHQLSSRSGDPVFYDRTTAIGALPKPVALRAGNALGSEAIYEDLRETVILWARRLAAPATTDEGVYEDVQEAMSGLEKAITSMDKFVTEMLESEVAGPRTVGTPVLTAQGDNQEVSIPPPPPTEFHHHRAQS